MGIPGIASSGQRGCRGHGQSRYSQGRHGVSEGCVQRTDSSEMFLEASFTTWWRLDNGCWGLREGAVQTRVGSASEKWMG